MTDKPLAYVVKNGIVVEQDGAAISHGQRVSDHAEYLVWSVHDPQNLPDLITAAGIAGDGSVRQIAPSVIRDIFHPIWHHGELGSRPRHVFLARLAAALRQYGTDEQNAALHRDFAASADTTFAVRTVDETGGDIVLLEARSRGGEACVKYPGVISSHTSPLDLLDYWMGERRDLSPLLLPADRGRAIPALYGALQEMMARNQGNLRITAQLAGFETALKRHGISLRRDMPGALRATGQEIPAWFHG